jgi:hypothetical protein
MVVQPAQIVAFTKRLNVKAGNTGNFSVFKTPVPKNKFHFSALVPNTLGINIFLQHYFMKRHRSL